jgi:ABC-type amino acid transport substrate-binding protein
MLRLAILGVATFLSTAAALAQGGVPSELFNNTRRQAGDTIKACFDRTSLGRPFDQAVAEAIGDALFLDVTTIEGFGGFPVNGDGFLDELALAMNNTCDIFMGVSVTSGNQISDAFSVTRPYATIPFVVAVANPDWQSLADIPKDQRLGTALASLGELNYINWQQQQPEAARWRRLPYADPNLMATRVLDGTLAGMILWQPVLARLKGERADASILHVVDSNPVPPTEVRVGALVSSRNNFLRSQVDQAIDALTADGTIDRLMAENGFEGRAGE